MPELIVRPVTAEDAPAICQLLGLTQTVTMKAILGEMDGKLVGAGGLFLVRGRWFAFCDLEQEVRPYKMTIMRTALRIIDDAKQSGVRFIYALVSQTEPGAIAWLTRLGFEPDHRSDRLYRWSAKQTWQK